MIECEYPLGHRFRREEAVPKLLEKFSANIETHFSQKQKRNIYENCTNYEKLAAMSVNEFIDLFL